MADKIPGVHSDPDILGGRRSSSERACLFVRCSITWNMADRSRNSSTTFRPWKRR